MFWVIAVSILVSVAFFITFWQTVDLWTAGNVAAGLSFLYLVFLLLRTVRLIESKRWRRLSAVIAAVVLTGLVLSWSASYVGSHFSYDVLHTVRKSINHGIMVDELHTRAFEAFAEFHRQPEPRPMSLGEIFRQRNPPLAPNSSLLDTGEVANDGLRVHLAFLSDTSIILIGQSTSTDGEDPTFPNFDGHIGMTQDRLILTPKGISFEIQN